jgi:thiol-disulfide isomerase/thioredoxin
MKKSNFRAKILKKLFFVFALAQIFSLTLAAQTASEKDKSPNNAQTNLPQVVQVDEAALGNLLKPNGKPVLVNFWATWCGPCVEEFPEFVKINLEYKDKLDVKAVSLDDVEEINREVPKFLAKVKSEIPAYLLKANNEDEAIQSVDKSWQGALPFTVLIGADGKVAYVKQGIIDAKILRGEIDKSLSKTNSAITQIFEVPMPKLRSTNEGIEDARKDIAGNFLKIKRYGLTVAIPAEQILKLKKSYGIEIVENGCVLFGVTAEYFKSYNEQMKTEIKKRFGESVAANLPI